MIKKLIILLGILGNSFISHGQALNTTPPERRFYLGLEGVIFANQATRFTQAVPYVTAADKDLSPRPAFLLGYRASPRLSLEVRVQDLPVLSGYSYQQEMPASYLGFGQSYTQDYLYLPLHAVWRVAGTKPSSKLALSIVAGGGPAWTDTRPSLITPNGTKYFTSSNDGTIGVGPAPGPGVVTAAVTQLMTQQQGFLMGLEAGLRASWQPLRRLGADLTVRQLWSTTRSARDIQLTMQLDNQRFDTVMQSPVRGICTGLAIRYSL